MACRYIYNGKKYTENQLKSLYNTLVEDETFYQNDRSILQKIGRRFDMSSTGFMSKHIDPRELRRHLDRYYMTHVKIAKAKSGGYFLRIGGRKYNPFGNDYYQLSASEVPVNNKLDRIIMQFLDAIGAQVNWPESLEEDGVAKVDVLNKIISVAHGRAGIDTLTEEATHIMIALMRNSPAYNKMMNVITDLDIYHETAREYKDLKNYDERKVKEEAVVKLVTTFAVQEGLKKDRNYLQLQTWIDLIMQGINWVLDLARKNKDVDPVDVFRQTARNLIDINISHLPRNVTPLTPGATEETFLQVTPNPTLAKKIDDYIEQVDNMSFEIREGRYYIPFLDKYVRFRPTDRVGRYARYLYGQSEFTPQNKKLYTTKGTIIHMYNQILMEDLIKNGKYTMKSDEIESIVKKNLKDHPDFQDVPPNYFKLNVAHVNTLKSGVRYLYDEIITRDPDARIITEQIIYNKKNVVDDIAGTVDVFVRYSDGTIGMYDYKAIKFAWDGRSKDYWDISDKKRQLYDIQLSDYKKILKEAWGLTDSDFRESRIVPINVQYNFKEGDVLNSSFKAMEMMSSSTQSLRKTKDRHYKTYLSHLTVGNEFLQEKEQMNIYLRKLYEQRDKLRGDTNERGDKGKRARLALTKINNTINNIIVDEDINEALADISNVINDIQTNYNEFSPSKVLDYLTFIRIHKSANTAFKELIEDWEDKEREAAEKKIVQYNHLIDIAESNVKQRVVDLAQSYTDLDVREGGKVSDIWGQYFEGIAEYNNNVIFTISTLLAEAREKVLRGSDEFEGLLPVDQKIDNIHDAYMKWANSKGLSSTNAFDPLINPNSGNLITRYKQQFYDDYKEVVTQGRNKFYSKKEQDYSKEKKWMETYYEFNKKRWEEDYERTKKMLDDNASYSEKAKKEELKKIEALNPEKNDGAWFVYNNQRKYLRLKKDLDSDYVSEEWKYISRPENKAAMEYMQLYLDMNSKMRKMVGYDNMSSNFVANIHANTIEKMGALGITNLVSLWKDITRSIEIRQHDVQKGKIDINTGESLLNIPALYLDRLKQTVTPRELFDIKAEVSKIYPRDSIEFHNEVDKRKNDLAYKKGVEDKSKDLTFNLKMMYAAALDYKFKSDIEDSILVLREMLTLDQHQEIPTGKYNEPILSAITDTIYKRRGASQITLDIADSFIKLHLYGQRIQNKDWMKTIGERTYSGTKMLQLAQSYLSLKALGLNPILAGASNLGAQVNKRIVGAKGIYFSNESWSSALTGWTNRDDKVIDAIYFFEPSSRNLSYDRALRKSASASKKVFNQRQFYMLHRGIGNKRGSKRRDIDNPIFGDDNVDNTILISMLKHWVLDSDGKIRSKGDPLRPPKNKDAKTLWELFKVDPKTDKMEVEGLSTKEFVRFRRLVAQAQGRVKGSLTEDQMFLANTKIAGMTLMKFRNWLPQLARERWGRFKYNRLLESWEQGHHRGVAQELFPSLQMIQHEQEIYAFGLGGIIGNVVIPTIKNFSALLTEVVSFGLYKYKVDEKKAEWHRLKYIADNPGFGVEDMTTEQFVEFRSRQLRGLATELRYLLGFSAIILGMLSMGWDDEDENLLAFNVYRLARRAKLELSFFWEWGSVTEIIKSPFPVMRVMDDLTKSLGNFIQEGAEGIGLIEENTRDRTPMWHYTLKQTPGVNQVLALSAYFDDRSKPKSLLQDIFFENYILSR